MGGDGERARGLVKGWDGGEEEGEEGVVEPRLHCGGQHFAECGRCEACAGVRRGRRRPSMADLCRGQASPRRGNGLCA